MSDRPNGISVVVPTWKRPDDLARCLRGLATQEVPPLEVVVVWRQGDEDVHRVTAAWDGPCPLRMVETFRPGVVAAMNRGLQAATSDIVALTDDDSFPHPDWCARLLRAYDAEPSPVAVGGRDLVHAGGEVVPARDTPVGVVSWFGRTSGNHHIGSGSPREVAFLKGVNCSFRRDALDGLLFDERLRGGGAQVHWELAFFLALGRRGPIVYDPGIQVDHFPAIRHDADQRDTFAAVAAADAAHNETMAILENLPWLRRVAYLAWAITLGSTAHPGVLQGARDRWIRHRPHAWRRVAATLLGRFDAIRSPNLRWTLPHRMRMP